MKTYIVEVKKFETWVFVKEVKAASKEAACKQFAYLLECVGVRKVRAALKGA